MTSLVSTLSHPVFQHMVWVFFLIASAFAFVVGVGLVLRSPAMLRFFDLMNRWISVRKAMKTLSVPHYVEPMLLKHRVQLGVVVVAGASISAFILGGFAPELFSPLFEGLVPKVTAMVLAVYTKQLLVIGNLLCIPVGLLMLFSPDLLTKLESYADKWYSVRQHTLPLTEMHVEVDHWVRTHSTVSGVALVVMSLGLAVSVLERL